MRTVWARELNEPQQVKRAMKQGINTGLRRYIGWLFLMWKPSPFRLIFPSALAYQRPKGKNYRAGDKSRAGIGLAEAKEKIQMALFQGYSNQ
jgi:hypothetical protein